ncbi:MAG: ABC transporter permease [Anaerolineae bacterium]|nr:ABC transporter permease [Anaerolineae bacterium]
MQAVWQEWALYIGRRLLQTIIVLLGLAAITFSLTRFLGNPVYLLVGVQADEETIRTVTARLGLDRPLWEQFLTYVWNLVRGDLGVSRFTSNTVAFDIRHRLPATLELSTAALLLGIAWTVPLGLLSARYRNGLIDRLSQALVEAGVAVPSFWLGLLLVYTLFFQFNLFPAPLGRLDLTVTAPPAVTGLLTVDSLLAGNWAAFRSAVSHLILPAVTLAFTSCPPILQMTRNAMVEILRSDYIRAARSYGLTERSIYFRYALKNALLPITTMIAITYGYLLGGTVLVEVVFAWPGLGLYAVDAMNNADYEPIVGVVLLSAVVYVTIYFLTDILHHLIDPRLRTQ